MGPTRAHRRHPAAALALLPVLAVPAAASPAWQGPQRISVGDTEATAPAVAADTRGGAVLGWQGGTASALWATHAATRPAGGEWTAPAVVSAPGDGDPEVPAPAALTPDVAAAPDGSAVAAWRYRDGGGYVVEAAVRAPDGTWGVPQVVSRAARRIEGPAVAVDATGAAVVVWVRQGQQTTSVQASTRPPGGPWGAPVTISAGAAADVAGAAVAAGPAGATAVWVWRGGPGGLWRVAAARTPGAGGRGWDAPADLSAPVPAPQVADVAVAPDGGAVAAWGPAAGGPVRAAARTADGGWGNPEQVTDPDALAGRPRVAVRADGIALVAVTEAVAVDRAVVRVLSREPAGWAPAATLGAETELARDALVGADARGGAVVAWTGCPQAGDCGARAAVLAAGTWLRTPVPGAPMTAADLAVAPGGDAVLAGERAAPDGGPAYIAAVGLDVAGPLLDGLSIPATAVAGQPARFAVAPVDAWSALAAPPVWEFSDGAPAQRGRVAERTYTREGPTRVRVVVRDVLGNTSVRTGVVEVVPAPPDAGAAAAAPPSAVVRGATPLVRRARDPRVAYVRATCQPVPSRTGCRVTVSFRLTVAARVRVSVGLGNARPVYRRTLRARAGVTRLVLPLRLGGGAARPGDRLVVRIGRPAGG